MKRMSGSVGTAFAKILGLKGVICEIWSTEAIVRFTRTSAAFVGVVQNRCWVAAGIAPKRSATDAKKLLRKLLQANTHGANRIFASVLIVPSSQTLVA